LHGANLNPRAGAVRIARDFVSMNARTSRARRMAIVSASIVLNVISAPFRSVAAIANTRSLRRQAWRRIGAIAEIGDGLVPAARRNDRQSCRSPRCGTVDSGYLAGAFASR
jgi:hypothetical protein